MSSSLYPSNLDESYSKSSRLLSSYNGRLDLITPDPPDVRFKMQERVSIESSPESYHNAMKGTWEKNVLSDVFFSKENIQIIQNGIRAGVYAKSGSQKIIVPPQDLDNLHIIMRSIFMQYADFYLDKITEQVERLNGLVLDFCIKDVYSASVAYLKYIKDQSTLVVPLKQPQHHDRNYKQLEFKPFVY